MSGVCLLGAGCAARGGRHSAGRAMHTDVRIVAHQGSQNTGITGICQECVCWAQGALREAGVTVLGEPCTPMCVLWHTRVARTHRDYQHMSGLFNGHRVRCAARASPCWAGLAP